MCASFGNRRQSALQPMRIGGKRMENLMVFIFLIVCSVYDCRYRCIPVKILYAGVFLGTVCSVSLCVSGRQQWVEAAAGIIPGLVVLFYGKYSRGRMGSADGWMTAAVGLWHGWEKCVSEAAAACFFVFLYALFLILSRRGNRNTRIPFAPFFLLAAVLMWITQVFGGYEGG